MDPLLENSEIFNESFFDEDESLDFDTDLLNNIEASSTYAGKVSQADISVPISHAAVGNESFIDAYNVSNANGFTISSASIPGIVLPAPSYPSDYKPSDSYEGTTGGAASVNGTYTKDMLKGFITRAADKYGVSRDFMLTLAELESGFNPKAVSYKKDKKTGKKIPVAYGLMQFIPSTAKSFGIDPLNPEQAADASAKYISNLLKKYNGNYAYAAAGYNAGSGAVDKYHGIPPFKETQNYVRNFMKRVGHLPGLSDGDPYYYSFKDNPQLISKDTGLINRAELNNLVYIFNNSAEFKGKVKHIYTNRPELLEDKPEYRDFKNFRNMKGSDGTSLFVKGNVAGLQLEVKNQQRSGKLNSNSLWGLSDDMTRTQNQDLPKTNNNQARALLDTFQSRYDSNIVSFGDDQRSYGLADLTTQEYLNYGLHPEALMNPIMQARVLNQEFQRANDLLKTERKAIYAIAGGTFVDETGKVKTWRQIKEDKYAFMKNWYIRPSGSDADIEKVNNLVETYEKRYRQLRGM